MRIKSIYRRKDVLFYFVHRSHKFSLVMEIGKYSIDDGMSVYLGSNQV